MSLQSWKDEFYPVDAEELINDCPTLSEAIQHSLTKWIGLRKDNLTRHDVVLYTSPLYVIESLDGNLAVDGDTCLLCLRYRYQCVNCILFMVLGGNSCCSDRNSPYQAFTYDSNPEPMIEALQKTLEYLKDE